MADCPDVLLTAATSQPPGRDTYAVAMERRKAVIDDRHLAGVGTIALWAATHLRATVVGRQLDASADTSSSWPMSERQQRSVIVPADELAPEPAIWRELIVPTDSPLPPLAPEARPARIHRLSR